MVNKNILVLFDIDGTLTAPRQKITFEMKKIIFDELTKYVQVGIVGGSDLVKQKEQLGEDILEKSLYSFSENGLVAYKQGSLINKTSINDYLGESNIKQLINWCLKYIAELDIPIKRGTFIEFRSGMINISPIGRNCSKEERDEFEKFDLVHKIRQTMIEKLRIEFEDLNLVYSIGGQISFDVFPNGWDKTYCLNFIDPNEFDQIYFFGDKTEPGGNDWEIFSHSRISGYSVKSPEDTINICEKLFIRV
jgi:phosphomannomutase